MLPPLLLLRSSAVSSRALLSPKPHLSRQTSLHFSSPSSSPSKRMEGDLTPDRPPGWRRSSYGRGSVSSGKSSMSRGDGSSKSSSVDFRNKSSHSNRPLQRQTSPARVMDSSDVRSPESDSVSSGKPSMSWDDGSSKSSSVDFRNKSSHSNRSLQRQTSPARVMDSSNVRSPESDSVSSGKSSMSWGDGSSKSSSVDFRNKSSHSNRSIQTQTSAVRVMDSSNVRSPESDSVVRPFDICKYESRGLVKLNKSIFEQNRERRKELEHTKEVPQHKHLRSGMILLKNHIGYDDQVRIIKRCREFGVGVGGFYTPGYSDGSKLRLQMMCLGKNWDPESRLYEVRRPFDGTTPPEIPEEFRELVDGAIQASHDYLRQSNRRMNAEVELPRMSPDLCIVNFYSKNGRLGLHQDKDESTESLAKGLPVVSFSLGDSAEFLFGEKRDADLAEKVLLESGDILIFGGKSRHLFHGVSTIHENTAPMRLIEETKLKPGRLNLTFRQY